MIIKGTVVTTLVLVAVLGVLLLALGGSSAKPVLAASGCVPPPSGLVSWWPGEGNADDIFYGNDGTLVGDTTFGAGKVGQAFEFDGNGDWIVVDHDPSLNLDNYTLDAWVKPSQFPFDWAALITKEAGPRPPSLWLYRDTVEVWVSPFGLAARSTGRLALNEWSHVAATYDGSAIAIYINGALDVSVPRVGTPPVNTHPFIFGAARENDGFYNFQGLMDEIEIFDRALTAAEIQSIYDAGSAGKCGPGVPVADAGDDRTFEWTSGSTEVTLDGTGSSDPQGDILSYSWTIVDRPLGSAATLSDANTATPTLTPDKLGDYEVEVTVDDGINETSSDTVIVTLVDTTPPSISAAFVPVRGGSGLFRVEYNCSDACDEGPSITSAILHVRDIEISVTNGQLVKLKASDEVMRIFQKLGGEKRDDGVLEIMAPSFELVVACEDSSGNAAQATAVPDFGSED